MNKIVLNHHSLLLLLLNLINSSKVMALTFMLTYLVIDRYMLV